MKEISIVFIILVLLYFFLGIVLLIFSVFYHRKEINFLTTAYFARALLYLAPGLLLFNINIEFSVWITGPLKVFIIPLYYLFVVKLFESDKSIKRKDLWHFAPFVIDLVFTIIIASNHASEVVGNKQFGVKEAFSTIWEENFYYTLLSATARSISFLQWGVYSIFIIPLIKQCIDLQKNEKAQVDYQYILWLKGIVGLFVVMGLFEGLAIFGVYSYPPVFILNFLILIFTGFFFFLFVVLFANKNNISDEPHEVINTETFSEEMDNKKWLKIFLEMEVFLDHGLTLQKTSLILDVPKYRLTQLIREEGYTNFYSLVNYYRVEKSKVLLMSLPDSHVIESVIEDSGFHSRSTYFRVFKEFTGVTPGEYLNNRHVMQLN